jgi:hypothetical protein
MVVHYFDVLAGTGVVGSSSNDALLINVENNGCSTQVRRYVEAKGKGIFSVETHGCSIYLRRDMEAKLQKERVSFSSPVSSIV